MRSRHAAPLRHPYHHGDLRDSVWLYDAQSDRQHGHRVEPTPDAATGNNSATTNTPVGTPVTDLRITNTNGVNGVVAGEPTTYTITITNPLGPSDASGATVTDTFPATLTGATWTCTATGGGVCPASGSGDINTAVTVPVGATVVFIATGTVDPAATGVLVNSAAVFPPTGYVNRASAIATDSDAIDAERRPAASPRRAPRPSSPATTWSTRSPSPTPGRRTPRA